MGLVFTMDQGPIIQHGLPMHDYSLSSDHDYNNQFPGHAHHHQSYTTAGAVDQLRRDGSAPLQPPAPFSFTATNNPPPTRYVPDRGVAHDTSSGYHASNNFTDSSSGSISTSPSSAASSLTYTNYPHGHCTSVASFPSSVQLPQSFVQPFGRAPPILDSSGSGMLPPPNPIRSPISSSTNTTDREAYANTSFLARSQLPPGSQAGYGSYPDTPRSTLSITGLSLSNQHNAYAHPTGHMASPGYNGSQQTECAANFPWPTLEVQLDLTCEGQSVTPEIHAKVEKGFFQAGDTRWTCYRRNYFSVQCSFEVHPNIHNGRMYLKKPNSSTAEQIQAFGMRLSAAVDGSAGKNIELVQHTPKRDAGPKNKIDVVKVSPSSTGRGDHATISPSMYPLPAYHATGHVPGPQLPLQADPTSSPSLAASQSTPGYGYGSQTTAHMPMPGQNVSHTFERVQFKQATANNGKRRASQQYFHLIVELYGDIRKDANADPVWVKCAHRVSDKIVVRGRSPSHYQNEGQNGPRAGSSGGSSGYNATAGATYGSGMTSGFRAAPSGYGGVMGAGTYRTNASAYGFHPSPEHSGSSASSVDGGAADSDFPGDAVMSDAERNDLQGQEGYRYYPAPLYEGVPQGGLPLPKIESGTRFSTDPSSWVVKNEYSESVPSGSQWPSNGLSRFQGVDSSRGYFPDLATTYS